MKNSRILIAPLFALLCLLTSAGHAQNSPNNPQPNDPQRVQQTRQLLDWLGLTQLLEQAPAALDASLDAEARFRSASPAQLEAWRRELQPRLRTQQLQQDLLNYVIERYRAETFARAEQLLQEPLVKRARYFDLAMTQPGAAKTLAQLRAQPHGPASAARRALVQEVDAAAATSLLVAVLQTGISERVRRAAAGAASDEALLQTEIAERQRFLAPLTADYALYAYRYLSDEELSAYRDLLRDEQLQWLLDVSRQGLAAALQGDIRPPDSTR